MSLSCPGTTPTFLSKPYTIPSPTAAKLGKKQERSLFPSIFQVSLSVTVYRVYLLIVAGFNTSLTLQTHNKTIPAQPSLGNLLSRLPITLPAPRLHTPKPPKEG